MKPLYYYTRGKVYKCYWQDEIYSHINERSDYCNYSCVGCGRRKIVTLNDVDPAIYNGGFYPDYDFQCPDCAPKRYLTEQEFKEKLVDIRND